MPLLARLGSLWRNITQRTRVERALDEELESYLELLVAEKIAAGLEPEQARRIAHIEIGGVTQVKERVRRVRTGALLDSLRSDLRYAMRSLARNPGFTVTAVLCLTLGIGFNTAIFSVLDTVLHPRFGFVPSDELVVLQSSRPRHGIPTAGVSYPDFRDWRDQATSFAGMAGYARQSAAVTGHDEPVQLSGGAVSWNLFSLLDVRPSLGRSFREDEDRRGAPGTVVLAHDTWARLFDGDSSIIGRTLDINEQPHTVIGVMPPRFGFPSNVALWTPLARVANDTARNYRSLTVFARLNSRVTPQRASTELTAISARLAEAYPASNSAWTARIALLSDHLGSREGLLSALAMMGAVTFVLLIACTNVANLMLARGTVRRREIAIRSALGAGRGRTIRLLMTESLLLAMAGGILGVAVAMGALHLLDVALPDSSVPYYIDWRIDRSALIHMSLISIATALAFGLAPALLVSGGTLQQPLKQGTRESGIGRRPARVRGSLVVVQVALSMVLLVGATLFARTLRNLSEFDPGFVTQSLLNLRVTLSGARYADVSSRARLVDDLISRIEAVPGVVAATASHTVTIDGGFDGGGPAEADPPPTSGERVPDIRWNAVTPHWFRTFDIPVIRGRDFTDAEGRDSAFVAVINETMAKRLWADGDAVGRRFHFAGFDTALPWFTIIGVTADAPGIHAGARQQALAFLPYPYGTSRTVSLTIRTGLSDPVQVVPAVRRAIRDADPRVPVFDVRTMDELRRLSYADTAVLGAIFLALGLIAVGLAAVGVYGMISFAVAQRTHEIGVRMALGARGPEILRMFVAQGFRLTAIGVVVGLAGALALTRIIESMLYGVSATDPISFVAGSLFLCSVALAASYLPARRGVRLDPVQALRAE